MLLNVIARLRPAPPAPPAPWPERGREEAWMRAKLAYARAQGSDSASLLFNVSSGDYLPLLIHASSSFDRKQLEAYRRIKAENPDLVAHARANIGRYSRSTICDPQDLPAFDICR